jgi:hypothetical protein
MGGRGGHGLYSCGSKENFEAYVKTKIAFIIHLMGAI